MRKLLTLLIIPVFFLLLIFPFSVSAKVISMEKGLVEIGKEEVINDDLFVGAETVDIQGTVNGDVYVGAQTVRVGGTINGDLHVGSGMFYLSGFVREDVYAASGNVTLSKAIVGDSLHVGAGNVNIDEASSIGGSLLVGSGTANVYAPVKRNVFIGAGSVDLNSEVGREVRLAAGQISVGPNTKIGKDFYYALGEESQDLRMSEEASVSGMIKKMDLGFAYRQDFETARGSVAKAFRGISVLANLLSFFGALIVGSLWLKFFPKASKDTAGQVSKTFFKSLGVGVLISIIIIPALILLAITGVGFPLAGITFLIFLISLYLTKIVVGYSLGIWLKERFNWKDMSQGITFTIGLAVLYLLKIIPVIGAVSSIVVLWVGLGALVLYYKSSLYTSSSKKV